MINTGKANLFGKTQTELQQLLAQLDEPEYRATQLMTWVYQKRITEFSAMTNLGKNLRARLDAHFEILIPADFEKHLSVDGSIKYVFRLHDGATIEAVYMVMTKGITMCLSSQVGCAQACTFCLTAAMGFVRNLTPAEIVGQAFTIVRDQALEGPFNVVMMGMGEPLLNLTNLLGALDIFTSPQGLNLSPKRITVSTSGHVRNLLKLAEHKPLPRIAISLNASTDAQRNHLMPVNLKWNIAELIAACKALPLGPRDRVTMEYVLIRDVNDTPQDAKRLVKLLSHLRCKVNLIPFNEAEGLTYRQPALPVIEAFRQILNRAGILNTVRWSKGRDIGAACGQLATPVIGKSARLSGLPPRRARPAALRPDAAQPV